MKSNQRPVTSELVIRHKVAVSDGDWMSPCAQFRQWIPSDPSHRLRRQSDNFAVELWVDRSCLIMPITRPPGSDDITKWLTLRAGFVWIDVKASAIPKKLAQFVMGEREASRDSPNDRRRDSANDQALRADYADLGTRVFTIVIESLNRFLAFCRTTKGQFWLREHVVETDRINSFNAACNATVSQDGSKWRRWSPPFVDHIKIVVGDDGRSVAMADWESAQSDFSATGRPDLVLEILANAELLAHQGNQRSALVEAVSALEVAVNDMGRNPAKSLLISEEIHYILQNSTLQNIAQRMGLTATVTILLPIIIPKTDLPKNILVTCGNAILQRQNVVHNGQRQVDAPQLRGMIRAIRELCEVLKRHTEPRGAK